MPDRLEQMRSVQNIAMSVGISGLASVLSYLLKVVEGKSFSWRELFVHGCCSSFFGYVILEFMLFRGYPIELCGAMCGLAGWGGTRLLRLLEVLVVKRSGVTKQDYERAKEVLNDGD